MNIHNTIITTISSNKLSKINSISKIGYYIKSISIAFIYIILIDNYIRCQIQKLPLQQKKI